MSKGLRLRVVDLSELIDNLTSFRGILIARHFIHDEDGIFLVVIGTW